MSDAASTTGHQTAGDHPGGVARFGIRVLGAVAIAALVLIVLNGREPYGSLPEP